MKNELDFSLLPSVNRMSIWNLLDADLDQKLQGVGLFSETLGRLRAAAYFLAAFGPNTKEAADSGERYWLSEALLRAGLSEFSSVNDTLARDLRRLGHSGPAREIQDSKNPLVHLLKLLRNINVHAGTSNVAPEASDVALENAGQIYEEMTIVVPTIDDLDIDKIYVKEVTRWYKRVDLERTIQWFNEKQRVFGAGHLLRTGVEAYCRELLSEYEKGDDA